MKKVIIIAWEFPGVNTKQGAALSRRIGQISYGLSEYFNVLVLHPNHLGESEGMVEINKNLKRLPIKIKPNNPKKFPLFRKIETFITTFFFGDRSSFWIRSFSEEVIKHVEGSNIIISFYTPRGPLFIARNISEKLNIPWIVDLQDPIDHGLNGMLKHIGNAWARRCLRKASKIIHIDPYWAKRDESILNKSILTFRHAVPDNWIEIPSPPIEPNRIRLIYAGSLSKTLQHIDLLKVSFCHMEEVTFELNLATNESVFHFFRDTLSHLKNVKINYLGWLDKNALINEIAKNNVLLFIPWQNRKVKGIPSKLYEYLSWNKPILVSGADSGSLQILFDELGCSATILDTIEKHVTCFYKMIGGDFSMCIQPKLIYPNTYKESDLSLNYKNLISQLSK